MCLWLTPPVPAVAAGPDGASYGEPTTRYAHGVLGDAVEWGSLTLWTGSCPSCAGQTERLSTITLPLERVFEDLEPRIVEIAPDRNVAMVVESHAAQGARLALYDHDGLLAATPYIGRRNRWLAPIGAADLDGDGHVELAYIDRPHLAKTLRIWRFVDETLVPVAERPGLTNHRIGEDFISGGLRDCGEGPELVTANGNWSRLMISRLHGGKIESREIGPFTGSDSFSTALACR